MNKKWISHLFISLLLILSTVSCGASGGADSFIPSSAVMVANMDIQGVLNSPLIDPIVDGAKSSTGQDLFAEIDKQLSESLGIKKEDIKAMKIFALDLPTDPGAVNDAGAGILVDLGSADAVKTIEESSEISSLDKMSYNSQDFYGKDKIFFFFSGQYAVMSTTQDILKKMIDSNKNGDNISKNQELIKIANQGSRKTIYLAMQIPKKLLEGMANTGMGLDVGDMKTVLLTIDFQEQLVVEAVLDMGNKKSASGIAAIAGMMLMSKNQIVQGLAQMGISEPAAKDFVNSISSEKDETLAKFSASFTKTFIEEAVLFAPQAMRMFAPQLDPGY